MRTVRHGNENCRIVASKLFCRAWIQLQQSLRVKKMTNEIAVRESIPDLVAVAGNIQQGRQGSRQVIPRVQRQRPGLPAIVHRHAGIGRPEIYAAIQ